MSDIALIFGDDGLADIGAAGTDLQTDEGLSTAIIVSLFTDRRAEGEELPAGETSRRGWWGDTVPQVAGDRIGSRLWLLYREKQLPAVIARAEEYVREALQWLIEDRVADRFDVLVEATRFGQLDIQVTIYRPRGDAVQYRYNYAWQSQAAQVVQG